MKVIRVSLPRALLRDLDALVASGRFASREEALRAAPSLAVWSGASRRPFWTG